MCICPRTYIRSTGTTNVDGGSFGSSDTRARNHSRVDVVHRLKVCGVSISAFLLRSASLFAGMDALVHASTAAPAHTARLVVVGHLPQEARHFLDTFQEPRHVVLVIRSFHWWNALDGGQACGGVWFDIAMYRDRKSVV